MTVSSPSLIGEFNHTRLRPAFYISAAIVTAFLVSLIVRSTGSYYLPVDGWGVDLFEYAMGGLIILRYFDHSWRSTQTPTRYFPLVLGVACISWATGDVATTVQSFGGASAAVPSVSDGFYTGFFPICFLSFVLLIRRGNVGSLVATSIDGMVAALGAASLTAAYLFNAVLTANGSGKLATATKLIYPIGDVLLLALAIGAMAVLPVVYRRFFLFGSGAMVVLIVGDMYNLLDPNVRTGYVSNAVAWPIAMLMLAIGTWAQPAVTDQVITDKAVNAEEAGSERSAGFVIPAVGALAAIVILFSDSAGHMGKPAVGLATATLLVAGLRLTLTVREAQALNSARFRSLIDNAWDVIVVAEADYGVAYITPSSERVLGYAPREIQGRPMSEFVHPDDTMVMVDHLGQTTYGSNRTTAFETRMRHRNGEWRTISWTATNLLDDESVRGFVLNGGDVTDMRQAAEDLVAARDVALMASKAKSDFLSVMSHEIRTPMNGVIGLTELLLETELDHDQEELASGVRVSAENLLVIINDILDFSKIEAGKLEVEETDLNVPGVADDVGRILAGTAHTKELELLVDVHPDVPTGLLGDGVRIQQVLLNLGSNAVKFTSKGEVVVRISVLDHNAARVALRFEVIDQGIGIAQSDQERLFSAFAQADTSTTRKYGGTGLGLAISRQLVELMGGRLGLISAPGEGSTFWFELSFRRAESLASPELSANSEILEGRRALIVDDNATNRVILLKQFMSWGVEAVESDGGLQALELAAAAAEAGQAFDIGVIDLNMPDMDGIEVAAALKADPATAKMTLILLSSSGERLDAAESHLRGFAGSLTKPVRQSELYNSLISGLHDGITEMPSSEPVPSQRQIAEMKGSILLVEDNKMNQLVSTKLLTKLGFSFEIANHGGEAIRALETDSFDAVLMDCQMPIMDGYEATAEIRRIEGNGRHTPIIAMTAAAMEGDREKCLAAGMDDYITKPVRLEAIAAMLERWIPRLVTDQDEGDNTADASENVTVEALDHSQIELLRSLDDGDGAVLTEIIEQFLSQTLEGRAELERGLQEGDSSSLQRTAHTIRGASANIGASTLAAVCAEIETRGRDVQLNGTAGLVEQFDAEFARVRDALSQLVLTP
jgi:PAS domain S-box-containing protein